MIDSFLQAAPVLQLLEKSGYEAYFVGGSVRDFLLKRPISDVDIATSATPEEMKQVFQKTIDVGIEHGTLLVLYKGNSYEITTFRSESEYVDFRRPKEVAFIRSLLKDLQRRDFTMNAIAMDHKGNIIDPFQGQKALQEKLIQTVGSAEERFTEDALRMMRAVRFVSTLSFTIESETLLALQRHKNLLEMIAIERKRAEFEKLLTGANRRIAFQVLIETGIYMFLPAFKNKNVVLSRLMECECADLKINEMWLLIIYFLQAIEKQEIEAFLREWKLPVKQMKEINRLYFFLKKRLSSEWEAHDLYLAGKEAIISVEKVYKAVSETMPEKGIDDWLELYEALPIKERAQLEVTGNDLLVWFNQPGGPWVKEMIEKAELAIIMGNIKNEHLEIKEWLEKCRQK